MDMCLTKLDAAGKPLWVSGFGGSKTDRAYGVITDATGNAYVTGHFESTDAMANGGVAVRATSMPSPRSSRPMASCCGCA